MTIKSVFVKNLKKGDKVSYYGVIFEITEDAENRGINNAKNKPNITNTWQDVWVAKCKPLTKTDCPILANYDGFQSNCYYMGSKYNVVG